MPLDFSKTQSRNMVNKVMKKVDETELDNKKRDIDVDLIDLNPDNEDVFGYAELDYLAESMKEDGFNGAIEVYAKKDGRYEISSGHRRYLAAKNNGMTKIPCIVSEDTDDITKAKRLIMSNVHHRKMSPLRWAKAIDYYDKHVLSVGDKDYTGKKRDELARRFNMSATSVHRYTSLLKLIPELQQYADQLNFPYYNFNSITTLSTKEQTEVYEILKGMSENGDLSSLSKVIIDQAVQRYLKTQEEKKNRTIKDEEFSRVDEAEESFPINSPVESDGMLSFSETSGFSDFSGFDNKIENAFNKDVDDRVEESGNPNVVVTDSSYNRRGIDSELKFLVNKISMLVSGDYKIDNQADIDECINTMNEVINKIKK